MQFFEKNEPLGLELIMSRFPYLSNILGLYKHLDINFDVDERVIKLHSKYSNPISTNIESELDYHKKFFFKNSLHKQPLAKALGLKKGTPPPCVLDVTAGMLGDTLLIYSFGCKVRALERHPIAYILSANALTENGIDITLEFRDAKTIESPVAVAYFDPMYSEKNEKSLPKKEMRIFRDVVGVDSDAIDTAVHLQSFCKRLVIKRSIKGAPLVENPSMTIKGKSTAYDVYLNLDM